ncbi:serine/threonine protein kinase [Streptomyces sp. NBC_01351]|uniref:serine/threonine-protein kinase n=1 Tax=Streptomyces sp. NBC_01351 TaxID=2903833 RepID=UPI002E3540C4|nr:serine/threonine-protein kinase [Streptomyces sp. NBC_01351]
MRALRETDPQAVGPYRLLAELGRGGMGRVLLASGPDGRMVALKQVHARLGADEAFRARFRREVAASRKVSGAFTAAVMDADPEAATPWLASVFVAGPALGAAVEAAGALPEAVVRRLGAGLATALVAIHRAGLVHRDLKPDNVLLAEDGVRVIDFGIARPAESGGDAAELTQTGMVVGSPAFMSPEQAEGKEPGPASDVFSLGSVLAMAASGRSPFAAASTLGTLYNVVHAEPELAGVPDGLRPLVEACLAKDPGARPSPARLLELIGPVAPAGPVGPSWPPAVLRLIAEQRAAVAGLVRGGPDRAGAGAGTGTGAGSGPEDLTVPLDRRRPAGPTAVLPPGGLPPASGGRRSRAAVWAAVAGLVLVGGLGVTAYALRPDGSGAEGGGGKASASPSPTAPVEPDRYTKLAECSEVAAKFGLPDRYEDADAHSDHGSSARAECRWLGTHEVGGELRWDPHPHAAVRWEIEIGHAAGESGTARQKGRFTMYAGMGLRFAPGLGIGEETYWDKPKEGETCVLAVRDGNLVIRVALGGEEHPAASCESEAMKAAKTALASVPR